MPQRSTGASRSSSSISARDVGGSRNADRVAEHHFVDAQIQQPLGHPPNSKGRDGAFIRAAKDDRDVRAYVDARGPRALDHGPRVVERLLDRPIDVGSAEALGRRDEQREVGHARAPARDPVPSDWAPGPRSAHRDACLFGRTPRRHRPCAARPWVHERGDLDPLVAGRGEQVDVADFGFGRNVARPRFAARRADRPRRCAPAGTAIRPTLAAPESRAALPLATCSPSWTQTSATEPACGASTTCSIFIASSTTSGWFWPPRSPGWTAILTTRPGIGAVSSPPSPPARLPTAASCDPRRLAAFEAVAAPCHSTIRASPRSLIVTRSPSTSSRERPRATNVHGLTVHVDDRAGSVAKQRPRRAPSARDRRGPTSRARPDAPAASRRGSARVAVGPGARRSSAATAAMTCGGTSANSSTQPCSSRKPVCSSPRRNAADSTVASSRSTLSRTPSMRISRSACASAARRGIATDVVGNDLGQQRVVVRRHRRPPRSQVSTRTPVGDVERLDRAARRQQAGQRVLGDDPRLDGVALEANVVLGQRQRARRPRRAAAAPPGPGP